MDISKEYIKMCKQAKELQENWKPQEGDWLTPMNMLDKDGNWVTACLSSFNWHKMNNTWKVLQYWLVNFFVDDDAPSNSWFEHSGGRFEMLTYKKFRSFNFIVWLPRQDQLQEIVYDMTGATGLRLIQNLSNIMSFCRPELFSDPIKEKDAIKKRQYAQQFGTFEKLWFAFVMKEKYNKKWNGKEWITF